MLLVTINGESKEFEKGTTITQMLKSLGVEEKVMAVAVNMQIVKKEEWDKFQPKEGDKIEFLGFTGGG